MKQIAVKGDDYDFYGEEFIDTYSDPEKKKPPKPDPPDPEDPDKYSEPPFWELISIKKENAADTGEEFVFCEGKPVVVVGYIFSKLTQKKIKRRWELDEYGHLKGYPKPKKDKDGKLVPVKPKTPFYGTPIDDVQDTNVYDVQAVDGTDFVFADGIPFSCINEGVIGGSVKVMYKNGEKIVIGSAEQEGEFVECFGHAYFES